MGGSHNPSAPLAFEKAGRESVVENMIIADLKGVDPFFVFAQFFAISELWVAS
jgi:hypothetical protein